jgi:uncharacterized membrane protein
MNYLLLDLQYFIGRFHPIAVHLPIGFLVLAFVLHLLVFRKNDHPLQHAIPTVLLLGALASIPAIAFGLLLSSEGAYDGATLDWHKYLGFSVFFLSLITWYFSKSGKSRSKASITIFSLLVFCVLITGHLGGTLTHGEGYLTQYAPNFLKTIFGEDKEESQNIVQYLPPDSINVFSHLVQPVLKQKCYGCHNSEKNRGKLDLTSMEGILNGGESGPFVLAGKSHQSELIKRVSLNRRNSKFMPPKGDPLSYGEIKILEWWINSGASFENNLLAAAMPDDVEHYLKNDFKVQTTRKPYIENLNVSFVPNRVLDQIKLAGFKILKISHTSNLLDVKYESGNGEITYEKLEELIKIKDQLVWLDLQNANLKDDMLQVIADFPNLVKLEISLNPIDGSGLEFLRKLKHLETLNLYGTRISDSSLELLTGLASIRNIYLWQTDVSPLAVEKLKSSIPYINVDTGFRF